jgi:hypothetical protein
MKIYGAFFLIAVFLKIGFEKDSSASSYNDRLLINTSVIVEGEVSYIELGSRTAEIVYPHGFKLVNCTWLQPSGDNGSQIFISRLMNKSLIGKQVKVWEKIKTIKSGGMYGSWYLVLVADSLRIIN